MKTSVISGTFYITFAFIFLFRAEAEDVTSDTSLVSNDEEKKVLTALAAPGCILKGIDSATVTRLIGPPDLVRSGNWIYYVDPNDVDRDRFSTFKSGAIVRISFKDGKVDKVEVFDLKSWFTTE
jgi:hypothetical protein